MGFLLVKYAPNELTAFIEVVLTDTVKYEIDKDSGYLRIDRPHKYSNVVPALYGFIPQTFCGIKWENIVPKKPVTLALLAMEILLIFVF